MEYQIIVGVYLFDAHYTNILKKKAHFPREPKINDYIDCGSDIKLKVIGVILPEGKNSIIEIICIDNVKWGTGDWNPKIKKKYLQNGFKLTESEKDTKKLKLFFK